jgi:HD superfamily phosphohydrolase
MSSNLGGVFDPLYGYIEAPPAITDLISRPIVQRLRHVRLSNIDSLDLPGIAGISRYEHSLGVAHLAHTAPFARKLSQENKTILVAAALLHDAAITPYGHLVEEAIQYHAAFNHEDRLKQAFFGETHDLGHRKLQLLGRENGLYQWATKHYGADASDALDQIFLAINGKGLMGAAISSQVDLDNVDNLVRIAFHMGLPVDRRLPIELVQCMSELSGDGGVVFTGAAPNLIQDWLHLRENVYTRLMLSRHDFVGKVMLISATVEAYRTGALDATQWVRTDGEFLRLLEERGPEASRRTVGQWNAGELWALTDLMWFGGPAPDFEDIAGFSTVVSERLGRECFAYRIVDKTTRLVTVRLADGEEVTLGREPKRWLLGVASPVRRTFTRADHRMLQAVAEEHLESTFQREGPAELELWA